MPRDDVVLDTDVRKVRGAAVGVVDDQELLQGAVAEEGVECDNVLEDRAYVAASCSEDYGFCRRVRTSNVSLTPSLVEVTSSD